MDEDDSSSINEFSTDEDHIGGDKEYNEFIVGADEYNDSPSVNEGLVLGGGSSIVMSCGISLLVIVLILVFMQMLNKNKRGGRSMARGIPANPMQNSCPKHADTFNNLLIPPSYFDYRAHGTQYINWTGNN